MYNCITVSGLEQHTHRFLWRDMDTNKPPDTYIPLVVMFGDKPSGAIAMTAMHLTADMYKSLYPEAAITRNSYVDDILKSTSSRQAAIELIREVDYILGKGGFKVKKWIISGNDAHSGTSVHATDSYETMTLGLRWKPKDDVFAFKYEVKKLQAAATKSETVGKLSSTFDPSGLLIPFTLKAKLCIWDISKTQGDWKEPVSEDVIRKTQQFLDELCLKPKNVVGDPTLVLFCDASELAYGACAYIRWECDDGTYYTYLICAKNRLAPLKTITIPRLELCAAVVGSRLKVTIYKELDFNFTKTYFITDLRIVQAQIYKDSYRFGLFVANRITEIQRNSSDAEWCWTDSKNNVADLTTRPTDVSKLSSYWKEGPDYLKKEIRHWPIDTEIDSACDLPGVKATINMTVRRLLHGQNFSDFHLNRFDDLHTLLRVTAMIFKMLRNKTFESSASKLDSRDISCTERLIKRCLELTIGTSILAFPELQTVFFVCANILNSRPIGCKDGDSAYFCPNNLILGRTSIRVPHGKFDMELNQRKRFEFIEGLITNFWKRWHTHYFENLILRQKWHVEHRNLRVGDIVLVPDSKSLRGNWKLAEFSGADPGSDGKVRDVELRYKIQDDSGNYTGVNDTKIKRSVQTSFNNSS